MDSAQYGREVGQRLRRARRNRLMSLAGAEAASGGRWDRAVIGSYERGDRAMKVETLVQLAEFYKIPAKYLLPPEDVSPGIDTAASLPERTPQLR